MIEHSGQCVLIRGRPHCGGRESEGRGSLLRGGETRRAHELTGEAQFHRVPHIDGDIDGEVLRQWPSVGVVTGENALPTGGTEIGDLEDVVAVEHQIRRFDVAMQHTL